MRVLQVIDSLARAGAEQSLVSVAPYLVRTGIDLHVAYLGPADDLRPQLEQHGVQVHYLGERGEERLKWFAGTSTLVRDLRPDVVHTTLFEADLAGRLAAARNRVPCISSLVNTAYGRRESTHLKPMRWRAAQAADAATGVLVTRWHAVTQHVAEVMSQRLLIPRKKIEVIPRGRDPERLGHRSPQRRAATRAKLGIPDGAPVMLAVGRLMHQKGLDVLMRAIPAVVDRHPDLVVLVAGRDGSASEQLRVLHGELGLQEIVRFLGSRDDVPDLLAAADVFTFPSRWEGAGGTLLEAMALECPIVTTNLPTLLETVDSRTALLVPPESEPDLARAILATLDDRAQASARARLARSRFEAEFTIDASAGRTAELYRRVAASGRERVRS